MFMDDIIAKTENKRNINPNTNFFFVVDSKESPCIGIEFLSTTLVTARM